MTEASLTSKTLEGLKASRVVALENLRFYESLYDGLDETVERKSIGRAMAQKQSFLSAIDAILKNHDIPVQDAPLTEPANDCSDVLKGVESGDHLAQEERFYDVVLSCMNDVEDALTKELLRHHLKAAELAVTAIKTTSLKI